MELTSNLPVNLIFGRGKAAEIGARASLLGHSALIVTGRNSTKQSGLLDAVKADLIASGMATAVFDRVTSNPDTYTAYQGAELIREKKYDVIIALGGGSIIDCAKAMAFSADNPGDLSDYIFGRKSGVSKIPVIAVPTTCGTGSEGNGFAVLTNPETHDKKSLRDISCVPILSIVDPELMLTMPRPVAASVMFDALCHNMEAFLSRATQTSSEELPLRGISLLGENMIRAYEDYGDSPAWDSVCLASTLGGVNIHVAGVTAPHGMEHPASGLHNITHGRGLAALVPVITAASIESAPEKYREISQLIGGENEFDLVDRLYEILDRMDLRTNLSKEGVRPEDIDWMTHNCLKVSAPSMASHPRVFSEEEIRDLYIQALND